MRGITFRYDLATWVMVRTGATLGSVSLCLPDSSGLTPSNWSLGSREGSYPGMLIQRCFHLVFVRPGHRIGADVTPNPDAIIHYSGSELIVPRPSN